MSDKFHVGQRVRIKDNAYRGSTHADDTALRNREGKITGQTSLFKIVTIPGDDLGHYLYDDELELVEDTAPAVED